jgi:alkylation response protein AidB-like acyl-CoA dehydrogenase
LTSERSRASATAGGPGPEASVGKLVGALLNQHIYEWCMDLLGPEGLLYKGYEMNEESGDAGGWRGPIQQRYLRSRANTIEGGTTEVMRNILGERVLGLPGDLRADAGMPWKEIPRG